MPHVSEIGKVSSMQDRLSTYDEKVLRRLIQLETARRQEGRQAPLAFIKRDTEAGAAMRRLDQMGIVYTLMRKGYGESEYTLIDTNQNSTHRAIDAWSTIQSSGTVDGDEWRLIMHPTGGWVNFWLLFISTWAGLITTFIIAWLWQRNKRLRFIGETDALTGVFNRKGGDIAVDKYLRDQGKYQKSESKISFQDVQDCLILVTNCFSTITSYENQTKKAITNKFIQEAMTEFFRAQLEIYFIEHKAEADRVMEQVLINKRSRETAEKARLNIKKKLTGNVDLANRVQKFVDCRSKDVSRREIYIVEGDSALGACKLSRDAEFQGIMPVRGKILNCLKADYARIFKSDVITDLMRVLGCGVEVQSKQAKDLSAFNLENLRWNKVIICTDADVDGFQIRTLILTMLYRLAPTLIREGYVYIAESPLYEIASKGKTYFAYSDREKAAIVDSLGGAKADINRSKGLGENDPEMMWLTTMNPDTRKLIRVMPEDVERTAQVFDLLLGDNLAGRKAHIAECGSQFLDLADIS